MATLAVLDAVSPPRVFGASPALAAGISISAATRAAGPFAPSTFGAPFALSDLTVGVQDETFAAANALANARTMQFQDAISEPGSGSFIVQHDDADLAAVTLSPASFVTYSVQGVNAWTMLVEAFESTAVASGEDGAQATRFSGRGHLAWLERGLVYPSRGVGQQPIEEDRQFNWTSPAYDDSGWGTADVIGLSEDVIEEGGWGYPFTGRSLVDVQFPDWQAAVLWVAPSTPYAGIPGEVYFRQLFVVPTDGTYMTFVLIDNAGEFYIDGQLICAPGSGGPSTFGNGFSQQTVSTLLLSAGTHLCAAHVTNQLNGAVPISGDGTQPTNPGMLLWCMYPVDAAGAGPQLVDHTITDLAFVSPAGVATAKSRGWCKMVAFPASPPGMSVGHVMRIALEECQARGALTGVSLAFSDSLDSNGNAWPVVADIATKVGTDLLTFFRELAGTYVDLWMEPASLILHAYRFGEMGSTPGVSYHPPTDPYDASSGNLTVLQQRGAI